MGIFSKDKLKDKLKKFLRWEELFIVTFFLVAIFSFLIGTGTLNSGYHYIDDHEMLGIKTMIKNDGLLDSIIGTVKNDLNIRFRPMYFVHRTLEMKIFGANFFALSFYTGLLAVVTFCFFYWGLRKMKYSILCSLFFVFLIFVGPQSAIWWRLGPNETLGMFFLGLAFLFLSKCSEEKNYKRNNWLFIFFLALASLSKEAFIVIIPAFIFLKIWNEKKVFAISFKEAFKKNRSSLILLVLMLIELLIIKFFVGTNKIGYAGVPSSFGEFIVGVERIILSSHSLFLWWMPMGFSLLFYWIDIFLQKKSWKKELMEIVIPTLIFSLAIVLPNILMHAKSGMTERYLLPTTFGLAFVLVVFLANTKNLFLKSIMFFIIFSFLQNSFSVAKTNAKIFAQEGMNANNLLSAVKVNSNSNSKILLVADPVDRYEVSNSIKIYLGYYGRENLYGYPIMREYVTDFEKSLRDGWLEWFKGKMLADMNGQPDVIIIFDKFQTDQFFSAGVLEKNKYKEITGGDQPSLVFVRE